MPALHYKNKTKNSSGESRDGLSGTWLASTAAKFVMTEGPKWGETLHKSGVYLAISTQNASGSVLLAKE